MSSLHHENITQFRGIFFLPNSTLPLLVMEKLETNLANYLRNDHTLAERVQILGDVASGLVYLHGRETPVIHRDLTARNVLLNSEPSLVAKISDMGNSRIFELRPGHGYSILARTLSNVPGTLVYMPPEAQDEDHRYGPSLDIFSFGHLALYTMIQVKLYYC